VDSRFLLLVGRDSCDCDVGLVRQQTPSEAPFLHTWGAARGRHSRVQRKDLRFWGRIPETFCPAPAHESDLSSWLILAGTGICFVVILYGLWCFAASASAPSSVALQLPSVEAASDSMSAASQPIETGPIEQSHDRSKQRQQRRPPVVIKPCTHIQPGQKKGGYKLRSRCEECAKLAKQAQMDENCSQVSRVSRWLWKCSHFGKSEKPAELNKPPLPTFPDASGAAAEVA